PRERKKTPGKVERLAEKTLAIILRNIAQIPGLMDIEHPAVPEYVSERPFEILFLIDRGILDQEAGQKKTVERGDPDGLPPPTFLHRQMNRTVRRHVNGFQLLTGLQC